MNARSLAVAAVALSCWGTVARADPAPPFLEGKRTLNEYDLEHKKEGAYFTGLPLVDSDPDLGFGFGARVYHYWDGEREGTFFAYAPYAHRVFVQGFATTKGYQYHTVDYDAPYLGGSPFRLRAALSYEKNVVANYFGRGTSTLDDLYLPSTGLRYRRFADYQAAARQLGPNGIAYSRYSQYWMQDPALTALVERDLAGGLVRVQAGFSASYFEIRDYTGTQVVADDPFTGQTDVSAAMGPTKLREDCDAGRVLGCGGGWNNLLKLGVAFDTRDFEPDPNDGVFIDGVLTASSRALGSTFDYLRLTLSPRVFVSPVPDYADLVIAARGVYSVQTGRVPFYAMNTFGFTDGDRYGLGGLRTLRGYRQDRFVGPIAALANVEVRWTFAEFELLSQFFALQAVPFFDAGRLYDDVPSFSLRGWKDSEGLGLHVAWNKATIIVCDVGVSREDTTLYFDFNQQF